MKTKKEIIERYRKIKQDDLFGFTAEILLSRLSFDEAKEFLTEDAKAENWKAEPFDEQTVLAEMKSYMEFAWSKVIDHRGLSASRSIEKMRAWLWLMGDDELLEYADVDENYAQYGAPILMKICEKYGLDIPQDESVKRMSQGLPCMENCDMGCGQ